MNCGSNLYRFLVEVILFALSIPVSVALPSTGGFILCLTGRQTLLSNTEL